MGGKGAKPQKSWTIETIVVDCAPQHPHTCQTHHGPEDGDYGADGCGPEGARSETMAAHDGEKASNDQFVHVCVDCFAALFTVEGVPEP